MNEVTGSGLDARAGFDARGVDARAAGAYARAEALAASAPIEPVRPGFRILDGDGPAKTGQARPQAAGTDPHRGAPATEAGGERPRAENGPGLLGALTNFLARAFGQPTETDGAQASARLAAVRSYAQSAVGKVGTERTGVELISPSLPTLSSGRTLDLSV